MLKHLYNMGQGLSVASGVNKKEFVFKWKIKNFNMIADNAELVSMQTNRLRTGENTDYFTEWEVSLKHCQKKVSLQAGIGLSFKLIQSDFKDNTWARISGSISNRKKGKAKGIFWEFDDSTRKYSLSEETVFRTKFFISLDQLQNIPLHKGTLTINLKITILVKRPDLSLESLSNALAAFEKTSKEKLIEDLGTMYDVQSPLKDLKVVSRTGKEYSANKFILAGRSPVFAAMFNSKMKEDHAGILHLEDIADDTVEFLLTYLHTGKLLQKMFPSCERIIDVAYVADKYELPELHSFCDEMFSKKVTRSNAQWMLSDAEKLRLTKSVAMINQLA